MRSMDEVFSPNNVIQMIFREATLMSLNIYELLNQEILVRIWLIIQMLFYLQDVKTIQAPGSYL